MHSFPTSSWHGLICCTLIISPRRAFPPVVWSAACCYKNKNRKAIAMLKLRKTFNGVQKQWRQKLLTRHCMVKAACKIAYTLEVKAVTQLTGLYSCDTIDRLIHDFKSCYASYCTTNLSCKKMRIYTKVYKTTSTQVQWYIETVWYIHTYTHTHTSCVGLSQAWQWSGMSWSPWGWASRSVGHSL